MTHLEMVTEVLILPTGCNLEDDESRQFGIHVRWKGVRNEKGSMGGYAVEHYRAQLTRALNWIHSPQRFQYHLCRWETLDEAIAAAHAVVDSLRVNRYTWSEWQEIRSRPTETEAS